MVKQFEKEIASFDGIDHIEMLAGAGKISHGHLLVYLKPLDERTVTENEVIARVRNVMKSHPGANPSVTMLNPLGGSESGGFGFQATMQGPDMETVSNYSLKLLSAGQHVPSIVDMKTSVSNSNPEIHVAVDRGRAADLGVSMSTVGDTLRTMVAGEDEISTYREGGEQYPVKIRVLEAQRRDMDAIGKLTVGSSTAGPVRIDNIARLDRGFGPTQISRTNREFSISITGDIAPGHALDEASNDLRGLIRGLKLPPGYSGILRGQTQILDETTANLLMAIALGSIFVYMVLAAQFESFVQPLIIMLVLPLSIPFALFTLWATGRTLNLWSALGTLLLFGIVKKNAILQVDYANVLRAQGVPLREAVVEACRTRLRPILMTTSAIIAGLIPTALGLGIGGAQRSAIAVTIIGGQSLCLFLTLLLVPVAYVNAAALEQRVDHWRLPNAAKRFAAATFGRLRPASARQPL
jgi:HAE1 family hydrophobic/amphiphilic exporter-1